MGETELAKRAFLAEEHVSALEHDLYDAVVRLEKQLADVTKEREEIVRLADKVHVNFITRLRTAVEALEWIEQENVAAPSTSRGHRWRARARQALAAISAPEEKSFDSLLSRSSLGTPEAMAVRAMASKAAVDKVLRRVDELDRAVEEKPECTCKPYEPADNPNCPQHGVTAK